MTPKYGSAFPEFCPDDLREDEVCAACGADPNIASRYCLARQNGPKPKPLLHFVLRHRDTGEIV